jgi:NADPH:quinone reductase-like Zn-dependent oxidoreductase
MVSGKDTPLDFWFLVWRCLCDVSSFLDGEGLIQLCALSLQVVVFGGNGFVGSRVVQAALSRGASVVSINRSGQPKSLSEAWVTQVKWVSGTLRWD